MKPYVLVSMVVLTLSTTVRVQAQERPFAAPDQLVLAPDVLLVINDSNPSAVTFTATLNGPTVGDSSHLFDDGIDLGGFFASSPTTTYDYVTVAPASKLTTGADSPTGPFFNGAHSDDGVVAGTFSDLNIYRIGPSLAPGDSSGNETEDFVIGTRAFTGSATIDLAGFTLPTPDTFGGIYVGYSQDFETLTQIGEYEVIPEPGTYTLLVVGGFGLLGFCVRRRLAGA